MVKLELEIEYYGRQVAPRTVYGRVQAGVVILTFTDDGRVRIHGLQIGLLLLRPQQVTKLLMSNNLGQGFVDRDMLTIRDRRYKITREI